MKLSTGINAQRYQRILLESFMNQLEETEVTNGTFQQDLSTAHTARTTINYLEDSS
jgi:hypothetical protein